MRWWKAVGLAGAAGVVATGVIVVRAERRRRAYTPEQVREQLHARFTQATTAESALSPVEPEATRADRLRERFCALVRRRRPIPRSSAKARSPHRSSGTTWRRRR
ncbi:hypothetical protein IU449_09805 [Nocardia higoensis]|uniref:Secreted protein n=1 Tax=Nocardia higoensis TaxID=228599 RepID=A0ABS0D8P4_9NOCA|nr:hypothetical protein [Nocardia higoensis]MBF6354835.1 hypothetical protein [Nocardia higoensis]